ncbi:hypothetical protein [Sorangium cellulosum]|nr:hypothetical protein [Sorangium cellulosum]
MDPGVLTAERSSLPAPDPKVLGPDNAVTYGDVNFGPSYCVIEPDPAHFPTGRGQLERNHKL